MFHKPKPMTFGGVYPGSGVAPGGQQGRPQFAHNGMGGVRPGGGPTIGATPPKLKPQRPIAGGFRPADHQALLAALLSTSVRGRR